MHQVSIQVAAELPGRAMIFVNGVLQEGVPALAGGNFFLGLLQAHHGFVEGSLLVRSARTLAVLAHRLPRLQFDLGARDLFLADLDFSLPVLESLLEPVNHSANLHLRAAKNILGVLAKLAQLVAELLDGLNRGNTRSTVHGFTRGYMVLRISS